MTTTYVALLRGINLGARRKVPMAELRELLTGLGFDGVRTHLQSGNAVFKTSDPDPGARMERALAERFGFEVPCVLRTLPELREVTDACPWPTDDMDPSNLLVQFLREEPAPDAFAGVDADVCAPDEFRHVGRTLYCYFPQGMGRSKLVGVLEAAAPGLTMTGRNWRTVSRVIELAKQCDAS